MKDCKVSYTVLQLEQAELMPEQLPVVTGNSWLCSHHLASGVSSHLSTLCAGLSFYLLIAAVTQNLTHLIVQWCKVLLIDTVFLTSVALIFESFAGSI